MAEGFEEIELIAPADILRRLGVSVTLAGVGGSTVRGAHGICLHADQLLDAVSAEEYDAVIVPGGGAAWALAKNQREQQVTCYPLPEVMQAVSAVATLTQAPVVRGEHLVTGMGPACALDFGFAVGAELVGADQVSQLRRDMCAEATCTGS